MQKVWLTILIIFVCFFTKAQKVIEIKNKSLESKNSSFLSLNVPHWIDCGQFHFFNESPPDVHPNSRWGNNTAPSHGNTYIGMVVRDNKTWESIGHRLDERTRIDTCYKFSIDLAIASKYISHSRLTNKERNYNIPTVLHIWGSTEPCDDREILATTKTINHLDWRKYQFVLKPKSRIKYIMLEAFYTSVSKPYCGNILIDNLSDFVECDCNTVLPTIASPANKISVIKK